MEIQFAWWKFSNLVDIFVSVTLTYNLHSSTLYTVTAWLKMGIFLIFNMVLLTFALKQEAFHIPNNTKHSIHNYNKNTTCIFSETKDLGKEQEMLL